MAVCKKTRDKDISFNLAGNPLVETPEEAIKVFNESKIDVNGLISSLEGDYISNEKSEIVNKELIEM